MHDDPALGETLLESSLPVTSRPPMRASAPKLDPARPRYEALRTIGRGGVGEVSLVHDHDIDRHVAIKRLRPDTTCQLDRFLEEIRTVGQLEHPNIAPIHDVGIDDQGRHFFVMRYVEGETLEQIISKLAAGDPAYHRRFTFEYRTQVFLGVLNAIHFAHARGIIHRDIKPSNIMVGPFGEVVVMDWGIAIKRGAQEPGALVGTPAYMAPEQVSGDPDTIDERSDIYSLCAVFYELLALRHYAPNRATLADMLGAVLAAEPDHPSHGAHACQATVPSELGWFVLKGLHKHASRRYQSIEETIDALQLAISGAFNVRCIVTFMRRGGIGALRFVNASPYLAVAIIALVLGLAALGGLVLVTRMLGT